MTKAAAGPANGSPNSATRSVLTTPVAWVAVLSLGLLILVAYVVVLTTPAVGLYHDDGIHLVTAKALAEGHGYRIISLPDDVAQTKYPILFPAALALIWLLFPAFPDNILPLKLIPFTAFLGWLWLAYVFLSREFHNKWVAIGCILLAALSPWILLLSTTLRSETLFAVFLWGALLSFRRFDRPAVYERQLIGAAALSVGAFLTRTIGVVLPITAVSILLKRHGMAAAGRFATYWGLFAGPWLIWLWLNTDTGDEISYYAASNYADWNVLTGFEWSDKVLVVFTNLGHILTAPAFLLGWSVSAAQILVILVSGLTVLGFAVWLKKGIDATSLFLLLYCAVLLLWAWHPVRFLVPVLPLLLALAWNGGHSALAYFRVPLRGRNIAILSVFALLIVNSGFLIGKETPRAQRTGVVCPPRPECTLYWEDVESVATWIRDNTAGDVRLIASYDPMLYLLTGRRTARAATFNPVSMMYRDPRRALDAFPACYLIDHMRAVDAEYLVETPTGRALEEWLLAGLVDRSRACDQGSLVEIRGEWESGVRLHRLQD